MREERRRRRQLRVAASQAVARWSEAPLFLPLRCRRAPAAPRASVSRLPSPSVLPRCLVAVLGGLVLAAAFEPVGLAVLLPVGVAAWALSIHGLRPGRAWLPSLIFGIAFIFTVMVWMRAVGTDAWLAMCALEAAFFVPLGIGVALSARLRWWPLWTAVWWVAVETLRSGWPFSGMPFGRLAFATADSVWAAALPWIGMTGVSLLVALTGTTLAWLVLEGRRTPGMALAAVGGLVVLVAAPHAVAYEVATEGSVTVAAVQGDVPGTGTDVVAVHRDVTANHVSATIQLADDVEAGAVEAPDLVVWPENSTAVDPFRDSEVNNAIVAASEAIGVPILVGAMVDAERDDQVLNQGIVWRPGIGGGDRYTKLHPVPYGEYIPFRGNPLIPSSYGKLRLIPRDMVRGTREDPLRIAGVRVADAICFDVAYDDGISAQVTRGADLITVQTSNAMFIDTGQIDQQFEISRLRAVEAGRWVVVAAINGVSGIIRPDGSVAASAGPRTQRVLVEEVGLAQHVTPASLMGTWPGRVIGALAVVHSAVAIVAYRRRGRRDSRSERPADEKVTV